MAIEVGGASIGIVLGSGLGDFVRRLSRPRVTPYEKVPGFPVSAIAGHAGELVCGYLGGIPVAVLSGRVHYYEGHPMERVVFAVRALARAGIKGMILTNAAGGIRRTLKAGDLLLISDHINAFGTNPLIGRNDDALGPRFPDMTEVYDARLRKIAKAAAAKLHAPLKEGVYVGLHGPSYETPAEIRMWSRLGADAVGMSTVPEAIALRHAGVRVLAISTITNMAAGIVRKPLDHAEVLRTGKRTAERLARLIEAMIAPLDRELRRDPA